MFFLDDHQSSEFYKAQRAFHRHIKFPADLKAGSHDNRKVLIKSDMSEAKIEIKYETGVRDGFGIFCRQWSVQRIQTNLWCVWQHL